MSRTTPAPALPSLSAPALPGFAADQGFDLGAVPYTGRVLIESLLRAGDPEQAAVLGKRLARGEDPDLEMPFRPARILVQDYTGIPLLVDLAVLRDRVAEPGRVNPALPIDVVVDHSVQTDWAGRPDALGLNEALEMSRNQERYAFLKWAEGAFDGLRVIPPGRGIVHQVNLERLATVVAQGPDGELFPDTVIGTDSHTTMVNGLGVLGWGVGGLEAEAQMLGLAQPLRVPQIVGVRLTGAVSPGTSPTDVVLTLTHAAAGGERPRPDAGVHRPGRRRTHRPRPVHHRQHGPRVRRHVRVLPGRRGDPGLPAPHRPHRGGRRPGPGLLLAPAAAA